jgi:4-hydroxy-tetrahydrodipicolinate reductase
LSLAPPAGDAGVGEGHGGTGLKATAMRLVNAIPAVVAAPPGLVSAPDLVLRPSRGLFARGDGG